MPPPALSRYYCKNAVARVTVLSIIFQCDLTNRNRFFRRWFTGDNVQLNTGLNTEKTAGVDRGMTLMFALLGIVVGCVLLVGIIVVSYCIHRRRNVNKQINNGNNGTAVYLLNIRYGRTRKSKVDFMFQADLSTITIDSVSAIVIDNTIPAVCWLQYENSH